MLFAGSFSEPRWREALVVGAEKDWTQLAVCTKKAEEIGSGVCSFSFSGKIYCIFCLNAKCTSCMQHVPARMSNLE